MVVIAASYEGNIVDAYLSQAFPACLCLLNET